MILSRLFRRSPEGEAAYPLYGAVVRQARRPAFYTVGGVADSVDGRFDLIALHAFLVMRRLRAEATDPAAALSQVLFDLMFADMDMNLREMGVSDLSVGRKVKEMARAFYGRVAAYDAGLGAGPPAGPPSASPEAASLEAALARNLYRGTPPAGSALADMAEYVRREAAGVAGQTFDVLKTGRIVFGPPPGGGSGDES